MLGISLKMRVCSNNLNNMSTIYIWAGAAVLLAFLQKVKGPEKLVGVHPRVSITEARKLVQSQAETVDLPGKVHT